MDSDLRDGLQDALAQLVAWLGEDYDGAKALHATARDEDRTWPVTQALLFMAQKGWRLYFEAIKRPESELIPTLQRIIANLAVQEDE